MSMKESALSNICDSQSNVINVETEVMKRKYDVDKQRLIKCLKEHKNLSCNEIAIALDKPKTLVEHWFRDDKCFAIPDADIWFQLKDLLNIETSEFDEAITTFEILPNKYDTANRIHIGDISPTYTASSEKMMFLVENYEEAKAIESHAQDARYNIGEINQPLSANMENDPANGGLVLEPILLESNQNHATVQTNGISTALPASMGMGGGYVPMVVMSVDTSHADDVVRIDDKVAPLQSRDYKGGKLIMETSQKYVLENHPADSRIKISEDGVVQTLSGRMGTGGNNTPMVMEESAYCVDMVAGKSTCGIHEEKAPTLATTHYGEPAVCEKKSVVRRLTPLECERLQGFPDKWTDIGEWTDSKGKLHKEADSPRYKALGNSIALPFWEWMAKRMVDQLKASGVQNPTMASLFDGIGGFPLVFSRCGCTPVWASEVEEFCIAVTKRRFSDENMENDTNT